jgi:EpsI family protein
MPRLSLHVRVWITAGMLLGATVLLHAMSHGERIVARQPLRGLPMVIGPWQGQEQPLEQRIIKLVSVDDYTNRAYFRNSSQPVFLYVGYYASQRTGDTIHSPKNCLPGAGWEPAKSEYLTIPMAGGQPIVVNKYVIEKGLDHQLVLYWYQSRGRVIASEYSAKIWMVLDAVTRNRTDGALVRLITPDPDGEQEAQRRLLDFAQRLYPQLGEFIPN